jgi:hypothetical protein
MLALVLSAMEQQETMLHMMVSRLSPLSLVVKVQFLQGLLLPHVKLTLLDHLLTKSLLSHAPCTISSEVMSWSKLATVYIPLLTIHQQEWLTYACLLAQALIGTPGDTRHIQSVMHALQDWPHTAKHEAFLLQSTVQLLTMRVRI